MSCSGCAAKEILSKSNILSGQNDLSCGKLDSYDWMNAIPDAGFIEITEVQFKNTRKEFFLNKEKLPLRRGEYVAVSSSKGHDVGVVALTGKLAELQYRKKNPRSEQFQTIYRKATVTDIEKLNSVRGKEKPVMIQARRIVEQLKLSMKISEVEFQADGSKAIFYYIADARVDFRELIKEFAQEFKVRIEMKQIGARQEAAMIGGIGSCGKELCCSSWRTNLDSVATNAARIQELPQNIQKLTGQCGKLKCCLMYELDSYLEAQADFPDMLLELETEAGIAYPKKRDVLKRIVWYGMSQATNNHLVPVPLQRVKDVIMLNKKGVKVASLVDGNANTQVVSVEYKSFENDLSILDKKPKAKNNKNRHKQKAKHSKSN